jgi:hypothetical protein
MPRLLTRVMTFYFVPICCILQIALSVLGQGCVSPQLASLAPASTPLQKGDYGPVLKTWTRQEEIYQGFDVRLFLHATYHAPAFRRAFAIAFPDIYGHGGEITRRELVDLSGNIENYHTFFVSAYTPEKKWNDFEQEDSIWRFSLIGDGSVEVGPEEIVLIKIDENIKTVFPYIDRFDQVYLIRFPMVDELGQTVVGPSTEKFQIKIVSALGQAHLTWELEAFDIHAPQKQEPPSVKSYQPPPF